MSADTVRAEAPGRVNLIGEHTDYNGGFVLPAAIPQRTRVELTPMDGHDVEVHSATLRATERYRLGGEQPGRGWLDYVQGITSVLASGGHRIRGFTARIESNVPLGSGLSSSAALEIALLRALRAAFGLSFSDEEMARLGQRAENEFVGAPVGIMDQMAGTFADESHALFLDTRALAYERVPIPADAALLVINSGVAHQHASGDYRTRRAECERAASQLGVPQLRDLEIADLSTVAALPDPLSRRARHVVTEDARVLETVAALRAGDLESVGRLFSASHASMRDDYEVSVPAVDLLVQIADAQTEVYGARLTGGGFGGAIVALARPENAHDTANRIATEYSRQSGNLATVLVPVDDR
jgi:galactokinase